MADPFKNLKKPKPIMLHGNPEPYVENFQEHKLRPDMYLLIVYTSASPQISEIGKQQYYLFDEYEVAENWKYLFEMPSTDNRSYEAEIKKLAVNVSPPFGKDVR